MYATTEANDPVPHYKQHRHGYRINYMYMDNAQVDRNTINVKMKGLGEGGTVQNIKKIIIYMYTLIAHVKRIIIIQRVKSTDKHSIRRLTIMS